MHKSDSGQSLMELVVVVAIVAIVLGALVFATIASIRNASFAKNQAQATKYAQEGLERVKTGRDRVGTSIVGFAMGGADGADGDNSVSSWKDDDMWDASISSTCNPCHFNVTKTGQLNSVSLSQAEPIPNTPFKRVIILSDNAATYTVEKIVTVQVSWTDFSGPHQSILTTILRKL